MKDKYVGAITTCDGRNMVIRYTRSLYGYQLKGGEKMEVKTEVGWIKTKLLHNKEKDIWSLEGLPHRNLLGLIVRTEVII